MWDKYLQSKITTTPHKGIVPKTHKSKRCWLGNWSKYIPLIRDLVYNNPRAEGQRGSMVSVLPDKRMLYDDSKDEVL